VKLYFAVLILFLAAFAGLAAGLLLKRKGLRGGCSPAFDSDRDCRCTAAPPAGEPAETVPHLQADGTQLCEDCPALSPQEQPRHSPDERSSSL
jgi:hypothetical protein